MNLYLVNIYDALYVLILLSLISTLLSKSLWEHFSIVFYILLRTVCMKHEGVMDWSVLVLVGAGCHFLNWDQLLLFSHFCHFSENLMVSRSVLVGFPLITCFRVWLINAFGSLVPPVTED